MYIFLNCPINYNQYHLVKHAFEDEANCWNDNNIKSHEEICFSCKTRNKIKDEPCDKTRYVKSKINH